MKIASTTALKTKKKSKGLDVLLKLFGNPDLLLEDYNDNLNNQSDDDIEAASVRSFERRKSNACKFKQLISIDNRRRVPAHGDDSDEEDTNADAISEKYFSLDRAGVKNDPQRMLYQGDGMQLGTLKVKKLSKFEQRAIKDIERIKQKKVNRLEKVF
jgi:hypothetical protein